MTWQLAAAVIVGAVLLAGFAWYEHSRPPAKVVALVAALAALAVVGRIAFAPFPNVKPTSDIVLLSGYALGPIPGFAVGAITALASNVVLGQGPGPHGRCSPGAESAPAAPCSRRWLAGASSRA